MLCTERESFEDVCSSPDAAVYSNLDLAFRYRRTLLQGVNRRGTAIQLSPSMIRHDDAIYTMLNGQLNICWGCDCLLSAASIVLEEGDEPPFSQISIGFACSFSQGITSVHSRLSSVLVNFARSSGRGTYRKLLGRSPFDRLIQTPQHQSTEYSESSDPLAM